MIKGEIAPAATVSASGVRYNRPRQFHCLGIVQNPMVIDCPPVVNPSVFVISFTLCRGAARTAVTAIFPDSKSAVFQFRVREGFGFVVFQCAVNELTTSAFGV